MVVFVVVVVDVAVAVVADVSVAVAAAVAVAVAVAVAADAVFVSRLNSFATLSRMAQNTSERKHSKILKIRYRTVAAEQGTL